MKSLLDLEDRYVKVNSIRTRDRHAGDSGPVVVLVHGLGGYVECWSTLFDALSADHQVYVFDLVGFGKTGKPEGSYNYSFFADFLRAFCDSLDIPKAHIIGWSLGGGTALQFAIKNPEMVEKLIVIGSGGLSKKLGFVLRILTAPTLVFWGKQDKIVPCESANVAERRIPDCELILLDECGHCPHLEYPMEVANRILEFLSIQ